MKLNGKKSLKSLIGLLILMLAMVTTLLAILAGCVPDHGDIPPAEKEALVRFSLQLPGANVPTTRALTEQEENEVTEIDVLVFEPQGGNYLYSARCSGSDITTDEGNSRKKTFTVQLRRGDFDLAIVANARDILTAATLAGKNKATALSALTAQISADNPIPIPIPIPMWGDIGDITVNENTDLTGENAIALARMVARVDVKVDEAVNNFILTGVYVYNYNTHGAVVPNTAAWNAAELKATAPTVPTASELTKGPLVYNNENDKTPINTTTNECAAEIYLFEAENHTGTDHEQAKDLLERTCIVVGGVYGNDESATYYRVDFSTGSGVTQSFIDVLRNHQYIFHITRVSGAGYGSPEVAFASGPVNIEANVLYWDQAMHHTVFDGQHVLSVSRDEYTFPVGATTGEGEDNVLYVLTDYTTTASGGASGWYVEKIVDAENDTQEITWLTLTPNNGAANSKTKVVLTTEENDSEAKRSAIIWIAAGRLRYAVKVTQVLTATLLPEWGALVTSSGNEVTELLFASRVGIRPAVQPLTITWRPITADLTVISTAVGANGFPTNSGAPVSEIITAGNGGTGTRSYTIQPAAFTIDELTTNPFPAEKVSKVDFILNNGTAYTSTGVFLRQMVYNLVTDAEPEYELDAQLKTIRVRANFNWKISVTDEDGILQNSSSLVGTTGGNNTTAAGDAVSFTMAADPEDGSKSEKTATITFTSTRDASVSFDITIATPKEEEEVPSDVMYVGYFGGALVNIGNDVWQFERKLYVQPEDESTGTAWQDPRVLTDVTIQDTDGKTATYDLYNYSSGSILPANLCFQKNDNYASISGVSNPNYKWYLPAQKQLMAVWTVHNSFDAANRFYSANYWSATETNAANSWYVSFSNGNTNSNIKTTSNRVRCVREIN